jgi:hypothetical protein
MNKSPPKVFCLSPAGGSIETGKENNYHNGETNGEGHLGTV